MNLDKKTKVCLKKLVQINREIYKRYLKIECRQNIEINTQEIFLLIEIKLILELLSLATSFTVVIVSPFIV